MLHTAFFYGAVFAIIGFLITTKPSLQFFSKLTPLEGLLVYYFITYLALMMLQRVGLTIGKMEFNTHLHTIGSMLIIFAFLTVFGLNSKFIVLFEEQDKETAMEKGTAITMQSEDGGLFFIWEKLLNGNMELARIMTYVVSPFILVTVGIQLIYGGTHHNLRKIKVG